MTSGTWRAWSEAFGHLSAGQLSVSGHCITSFCNTMAAAPMRGANHARCESLLARTIRLFEKAFDASQTAFVDFENSKMVKKLSEGPTFALSLLSGLLGVSRECGQAERAHQQRERLERSVRRRGAHVTTCSSSASYDSRSTVSGGISGGDIDKDAPTIL